jgi:hypothetical protein
MERLIVIRLLVFVIISGIVLFYIACDSQKTAPVWTELLDSENISRWKPTPGYEDQAQWVLKDGVFKGSNSWVGFPEEYDDFSFESDILLVGKSDGGIVIRGDRNSREPWNSGYELDIDLTSDGKQAKVRFWYPKHATEQGIFPLNEWHTIRIEAKGNLITVYLDGRKVISFSDAQFTRGNMCLEGHAGGVQYRNIRISR